MFFIIKNVGFKSEEVESETGVTPTSNIFFFFFAIKTLITFSFPFVFNGLEL